MHAQVSCRVDIIGGVHSSDHSTYFSSVFNNPVLLLTPRKPIPGYAPVTLQELATLLPATDPHQGTLSEAIVAYLGAGSSPDGIEVRLHSLRGSVPAMYNLCHFAKSLFVHFPIPESWSRTLGLCTIA